MALPNFKNGELIVAGSVADTELVLESNIPMPKTGALMANIIVVASAGGIQFSSGEPIVAGHRTWPAASSFRIAFSDLCRLHFKATNAADTFVITVSL